MKRKVFFGILLFFPLFFLILWLSMPNTSSYSKGRVLGSAFMDLRVKEAEEKGVKDFRIAQKYVPLEKISKYLIYAVLISEDDRFYFHKGFDWEGMKSAMEKNLRDFKISAGGSTITQQVAKNLFLSPQKSLMRKIKEAMITWKLENQLTKKRILEIYLNIAEWGKGVFGAEAVARTFFRKPASRLELFQGAVLASMLPQPVKAPIKHSRFRRLLGKTGIILRRMVKKKLISRSQYKVALGKARHFLGSLKSKVPVPR